MRMKATPLANFVTFKKLGSYGRLGNQLFQVSAVLSYAKKHGIEHVLPVWSNQWTEGADMSEVFRGPFNIDPNITNQSADDFVESSMEYAQIPRSRRINLQGYFQSELYFDQDLVREALSPELRIENEIVEKNVGLFEGFCSIHVRRDDYLKYPDIHPFLGTEYYRSAIERMKAEGYQNFLVFSDDSAWCRQNFVGPEFSFSDRNQKNYEDLFLMSLCSSHIIANSSFSWWGAWLSRNPHKIVIAPQRWFGENGPRKHNIIPNKWIQI